ncbi:MAG: hypothetical protein M5U30_21590 [Burkholderiaceae bacterium]|nr:hypothetical protein [Burkholderiaceae bacterium]
MLYNLVTGTGITALRGTAGAARADHDRAHQRAESADRHRGAAVARYRRSLRAGARHTAAILSVNTGSGFVVDVLAAVAISSALGFVAGYAFVRLTSIFFAVATLALAIPFYTTVLNWSDLTRGPMGYRGIPPVRLLGVDFRRLDGQLLPSPRCSASRRCWWCTA